MPFTHIRHNSQHLLVFISLFMNTTSDSLSQQNPKKQNGKIFICFRLLELYKRIANENAIEETKVSSEISTKSSRTILAKVTSHSSASSETETEKNIPEAQKEKLCIQYLLGLENLQTAEETISEQLAMQKGPYTKDEFKLSSSKPMREAQIYLQQHRIFDFFQFIITHLLSASPENPITFIMELLNKSLLYRSRLGQPPILYEKKHLEQLFNLMDRMRTGAIEMDQYRKGIASLGICDFNENPEINCEGLVTKKIFIEEAYKSQVIYFNDLIRVRQVNKKMEPSTLSDLEAITLDSAGSYFIPSRLLNPMQVSSSKCFKQSDIIEN